MTWRFPEKQGYTQSSSNLNIIFIWIFHEVNHPFLGLPPWRLWKPPHGTLSRDGLWPGKGWCRSQSVLAGSLVDFNVKLLKSWWINMQKPLKTSKHLEFLGEKTIKHLEFPWDFSRDLPQLSIFLLAFRVGVAQVAIEIAVVGTITCWLTPKPTANGGCWLYRLYMGPKQCGESDTISYPMLYVFCIISCPIISGRIQVQHVMQLKHGIQWDVQLDMILKLNQTLVVEIQMFQAKKQEAWVDFCFCLCK